MAIYGDSGMGKSMIVGRFNYDDAFFADSDRDRAQRKFLVIELSSGPGERRLYAQILLEKPHFVSCALSESRCYSSTKFTILSRAIQKTAEARRSPRPSRKSSVEDEEFGSLTGIDSRTPSELELTERGRDR